MPWRGNSRTIQLPNLLVQVATYVKNRDRVIFAIHCQDKLVSEVIAMGLEQVGPPAAFAVAGPAATTHDQPRINVAEHIDSHVTLVELCSYTYS